jgi:TRAP-type C4-dicarboxylate transport system permease small subunit
LLALIRLLKALDRAIAALELAIALFALAAILVLTAVPIGLRAAGGNSGAFWWTTPVSLYFLTTATFFAASLALRSRRHIQIDLVTRALPLRAKAAVGILGWLVAAAVLAALCRAAIYYVQANWNQLSKVEGLTKGPVEIAMPIALGVMVFRCLLASLEDLRGAWTGDVAYLAAFEHHEGADAAAPAPDLGGAP